MENILARMHLRVCSPAAVNDDAFFQHFCQDAFNDFLDAYSGHLPLPAVVIQAVEGDMKEKTFDGGVGVAKRLQQERHFQLSSKVVINVNSEVIHQVFNEYQYPYCLLYIFCACCCFTLLLMSNTAAPDRPAITTALPAVLVAKLPP